MAEKVEGDSSQEESRHSEPFRSLCSHYLRGCSLVAPCCDRVYPCRLCHNEKESHEIDRFAVKEVVCRKCDKRQEVAKTCSDCSITFARYSCFVCNLYDDLEKGQYHCSKCGICRIGGRDNFFHCDTCGLCLQVSLKESHKCIQEASRSNCPVCMEDLHSSRTAAHVPKCGHLLHNTCFKEMIKNGLYQCPQCQTSLMDMTSHWENMDSERQHWRLPQQLRDFNVKIQCRDCQKESETQFHFIGLKCAQCGSYNTVRCGSETLPLDDVDPAAHYQVPTPPSDLSEEEDEEDEEDLELALENALDNLFPLPIHELPPLSDSDGEYATPSSSQEDSQDDDDDDEAGVVFAQLFPPHIDLLMGEGYMGNIVNMFPLHMDLHSDEEEEEEGSGDDDEDEDFPPLNQFPFFGGPHHFIPYPPENGHQQDTPQIWEVFDNEDEGHVNSGQLNGEGGTLQDEWETSSEEEVVGGNEEDLGKEECLLPPTEEESNQLGDVAPAH